MKNTLYLLDTKRKHHSLFYGPHLVVQLGCGAFYTLIQLFFVACGLRTVFVFSFMFDDLFRDYAKVRNHM